VPWQTARDWINRARELGYLTRGKPGRAGAKPGPHLIADVGEVLAELGGDVPAAMAAVAGRLGASPQVVRRLLELAPRTAQRKDSSEGG
jgi:hypothetical protein